MISLAIHQPWPIRQWWMILSKIVKIAMIDYGLANQAQPNSGKGHLI